MQLVIRHNVPDDIFLTLKSILATSGYDERRVTHFICDLFLTLADITDSGGINGGRQDLAERFREYIDKRITERFTLDEASGVFHVSKRHLYLGVQGESGTTPGAYHTEAEVHRRLPVSCRDKLHDRRDFGDARVLRPELLFDGVQEEVRGFAGGVSEK